MKKHYKGLAVALSAVMLAAEVLQHMQDLQVKPAHRPHHQAIQAIAVLVRAAQLPQGTSSNSLTQNRQRWRIPLFM